MQTYHVRLESPVSKTYRCKRAADSLDIDVEKKSIHDFKVEADLTSPYQIGLILGASGSGKTTLAKSIFGEDCFKSILDESKPIIDQFPTDYDYEKCAKILTGVGLTQVPCWLRPVCTLSNGQKARAEAALLMCNQELTVIDEWTSVVDRTVAKVMSHCIQKHARREGKQIVLVSCHYDVVDWINPDWIIDCNNQTYVDRRSLCKDFKRTEQLQFDIREVSKDTWRYFSKYHYLSENLPGGKVKFYGLFHGQNQIGFQCFTNYVPHIHKHKPMVMHSNRVVIHPDYAGIGLGIQLATKCAELMVRQGYRVMAKFSSTPMYKSRIKMKEWKLIEIKRQIGKLPIGKTLLRVNGYRSNVKTYSFEYVG